MTKMTAVPARRSKTKDPFQLELGKEIAKRRSRGFSTGYSDAEISDKDEDHSNDYEEDFDSDTEGDSDDDLLQQYLSSATPMKSSTIPSEARSSKTDDKLVTNTEEENNLRQTTKSSPLLKKQNAVDEKQDDKNSLDDDPFLAFLNSDTQKIPPWKLQKHSESSLFQTHLFSKESTLKKKVTFVPTTASLSPRESSTQLSTLSQSQGESLKQSQNPTRTSVTDIVMPEAHSTLPGASNAQELKPKPAPRRSSEEELLKPQPKARQRHDSNRLSMSNESVARSLTKSPELQPLSEENAKKNDYIAKPLDYDVSKFPNLHRSALQPIAKRSEEVVDERDISTKVEKKEDVTATEKPIPDTTEAGKSLLQSDSDRTSSTEDLLAQLQAASDGKTSAEKIQEPLGTPTVKIDDKTQPSQTSDTLESEGKDSTSESFIDHTATTLQDDDSQKSALGELLKRPSSRRSTSRKSPRTPPVNYRGLGSLDGLQQLHTYKANDSQGLKNSTNVRSTVYLQWLADREKKLKVKKKQKIEEEEKENERKQKEMEDCLQEGESARRAWMEKKEVILKEQAQKKRREEKRLQREKIKVSEEKRKSSQKADIVRERALTEAKKRHREEVRKKREEEKEQKQKEREKKKKNAEELNNWMEKRSKQWQDDRKKEIKEKKKRENETKKAKDEKSKKAEDGYSRWREKKDEQDKERRKVNRHDEDRPPWSPANKVIPRVR